MRETDSIRIHFIENDAHISKVFTSHVPRVGDEIRLSKDKFFRVIRVVWVYDEPEFPFERVNVGVLSVGV